MIIACALFFSLLTLPIGEPRLLDRASVITEIQGWNEMQCTVGEYVWRSPDQFMAIFPGAEVRLLNMRSKTTVRLDVRQAFLLPYHISPDRSKYFTESWDGSRHRWGVEDLITEEELGTGSEDWPEGMPPLMPDVAGGRVHGGLRWSSDGRLMKYQFRPKGRDLCLAIQ